MSHRVTVVFTERHIDRTAAWSYHFYLKHSQFYIIVGETIFTADFDDNSSADALRELLAQGDVTNFFNYKII